MSFKIFSHDSDDGSPGQTEITISIKAGQADVLVVATQSDLDLTRYCFRCHSHWAGRLRTGGRANWATQVPGRDFRSDEERIQTE